MHLQKNGRKQENVKKRRKKKGRGYYFLETTR